MEITVKSINVLSKGKNNYGEWKLVKVITDKNVEYTTLAKNAEDIKPNMVIDIDELSMEVKDEKERWSFKKYEIVPPANGQELREVARQGGEMTTEMWTEKQRVERTSIEAQVAYKGVIELMAAQIILPEGEVAVAAIDWAMARLSTNNKETLEKPGPQETEPKATADQLKKIYATSVEKGYDPALATALMIRLYNTGHSKELTNSQASDFIGKLENGYGLE